MALSPVQKLSRFPLFSFPAAYFGLVSLFVCLSTSHDNNKKLRNTVFKYFIRPKIEEKTQKPDKLQRTFPANLFLLFTISFFSLFFAFLFFFTEIARKYVKGIVLKGGKNKTGYKNRWNLGGKVWVLWLMGLALALIQSKSK